MKEKQRDKDRQTDRQRVRARKHRNWFIVKMFWLWNVDPV